MDIDQATIRSNLEDKATEELILLRNEGTLTPEALTILNQIVESRNGEEMEPLEASKNLVDTNLISGAIPYLLDHFRGNRPLWSAFWLIGVVGFLGAILVTWLLLSIRTGRVWPATGVAVSLIQLIVWLFYLTVAPAAIWRCAYNSSRRGWGHLARGFLIMLIVGPVLLGVAAIALR